MSLSKARKLASGDVLIGIIIALGIFVILSQAVISLAFSAYDLIAYTRARISARHIALEEIETIRNVPYEDVGTIGGVPAGIFEQERVVQRNGQSYRVRTRVNNVDDEFDGLFPDDNVPSDYKRARVDVSWGGSSQSAFSEVVLITDIAPRGVETSTGGGALSILVFDAQGQPVPQALVQVTASTTPPVNTSYFTSDTGRVTITDAPTCTSCYIITVSKDGFSEDRTYTTDEVENPIKPPASVIPATLTEISFTIDEFASLAMVSTSYDENYTPLGNQIIRIRGSKIIGTDSLDLPLYKFDQEVVTDSQGGLEIEELEWDTYFVTLPDDSTSEIVFTSPISPFVATPSENINLQVTLEEDLGTSLAVVFEDQANNPVASVAATLKDDEGYEASASSGVDGSPNFGQVFFNALEDKIYTLIATASGFVQFEGNIEVVGDTNMNILLEPVNE